MQTLSSLLRPFRRLLFVGVVLGTLLAAIHPTRARAELVYENTLGSTNYSLFTREYGDDIVLAGTSRHLSEFSFLYNAILPAGVTTPAQWRLRIYANDGTRQYPDVVTSQRPSSLLWESASFPVLSGFVTNTLSLPLVQVPDRFTWTIEFSNIPQTREFGAGLIIANYPTLGAELALRGGGTTIGSYADFWVQMDPNDNNSWALNIFSANPDIGPQGNFWVRVSAVPEPTPLVLGTLGFGVLLWVFRRGRKA